MIKGRKPQRIFEWREGRQVSGYSKLLLAQAQPYFDLYLLKYPKGSCIAKHKDPVHERKHYRANLVLRRGKGGAFKLEGQPVFRLGPLTVFRPDLHWHEVSPITDGTRYVLSLGISI